MARGQDHIQPRSMKPSRSGAGVAVPSATTGRRVVISSGEDAAEFVLSSGQVQRITSGRTSIGRLIAGYADTAAEAERIGRSILVTYRVTPDGRAEPISEVLAEPMADGPLGGALARAKARGADKVADILKRADMLTAREFGSLIGASHETVNAKRKRHEVLGLEGATRGLRYPRWQVTDAGLPLPGLARLFDTLGAQPWTVFRFLLSRHAELGGRSALDALKAGQIDAVARAAENMAAGAFG